LVTPVATASGIEWADERIVGVSSWAPAGSHFAFWELGEDVYRPDYGYRLDGGLENTLRFFDGHSGGICTSGVQVQYSPYRSHVRDIVGWSSDGRVILDGQIGWPCGDTFEAAPTSMPEPAEGLLSPKGGFRFVDRVAATDCTDHHSVMLDANTGRSIVELAWRSESYIDAPCGVEPGWVEEGSYLIPESVELGPVLLSAREGVVRLAEGLVDSPESAYHVTSRALPRPGGGFAIALWQRAGGKPMGLYHADSGRLEALPFDSFLGASADGRWLAASGSGAPEHQEAEIWIRPASAVGAAWTPILGEGLVPESLRWSPDGARLAVAGPASVAVYRSPDGRRERYWSTRPYGERVESRVFVGPWSPDGRWVVAAGVHGQRTGLFLLEVSRWLAP
jgi:hypothetical protein